MGTMLNLKKSADVGLDGFEDPTEESVRKEDKINRKVKFFKNETFLKIKKKKLILIIIFNTALG